MKKEDEIIEYDLELSDEELDLLDSFAVFSRAEAEDGGIEVDDEIVDAVMERHRESTRIAVERNEIDASAIKEPEDIWKYVAELLMGTDVSWRLRDGFGCGRVVHSWYQFFDEGTYDEHVYIHFDINRLRHWKKVLDVMIRKWEERNG